MKFHTKASPGLVALGSAAVIAVYAAGFVKTRAAAARFEEPPAMRRPAPMPPAIVPLSPPVATTPARAESRHPATAPTPGSVPRALRAPSSSVTTASSETAGAEPRAHAPVTPPKAAETTTSATTTSATTTSSSSVPASAATPPVSDVATDAASSPKPADPPAPPKGQYRDGTYSGWGTSRHGDIEATVVIENGRIANAYISQCQTRYPCSFIAHLQAQVVIRQSADVDYVSGATQSAGAFYYAVLEALAKAH